MATIKIKNLESVEKAVSLKLRVAIRKMLRSKQVRNTIGAIIIADIKENISFGRPSPSTINWRRRYDSLNSTDPAYKRNKINAVFTGELLNDLATNVKADTIASSFVLEHSSKKHKKYQGVTKKIGSRSSYSDISKGIIEKLGYDYLKITRKGQFKITKFIKSELLKLI